MVHRILIFVGATLSAVWFGDHWGTGGAIAAGILGAILGVAFASGIDEPVSAISILPRWLLLIAGAVYAGAGLGWIVDQIVSTEGATTPTAILGGVIGLVLCSGVRPQ